MTEQFVEAGEAMRGGWFHTGDAAAVHLDGYVEFEID
jgi:acyl-CoA synthetase (AMP-forming)/AMP-acid ligase II